MVERQKEKYGWEFLFLGANIDAVTVAERFGISADRAVRYECDREGTLLNYQELSSSISMMRECSAPSASKAFACAAPDWAEKIKRDYKRRHR